ncbi:MAG: hypothetical protein J6Y84_01900 [Bacteroidaceae bacterium]|nr:hypothetical protein [Bacteroidaceae bacterium]
MKKTTTTICCLLLTLWASAQTWKAPEPPEKTDLKTGEELYLYNRDAKAFFLGDNDWGTRASVRQDYGYKVYIQPVEGTSFYYLTDFVETKNQLMYTYAYKSQGYQNVWVDFDSPVDESGERTMVWAFTLQDDGCYIIESAEGKDNEMSELYGKLGLVPSYGNNCLYLCSDFIFPDDIGKFMTSWYFVSPAVYTSYIAALKQYNAALALGATIDEAKTVPGVDAQAIKDAETVYNNSSSTQAQLEAAKETLAAIIYKARVANATVSNPLEMLQYQDIEQTFTDGTATGWISTTGAQNKQASNGNNAKDFSITGNHYENWGPSNFTPGKAYATAKNLPAGVYLLNALAYTTGGNDVYLYAGTRSSAVTAPNIDIDAPTEVYSYLTVGGDLEIGLRVEAQTTNWIGFDNVNLYFLGDSDEAYMLLAKNILSSDEDYVKLAGEEGYEFFEHATYDSYESLQAQLKAANTRDAVVSILDAYTQAHDAAGKSMKAYNAYYQLFLEASEWLESTTSESEAVYDLTDYLQIDEETGFNGNGTAPHILEAGTLTAEQIEAEKVYLNTLLTNAIAGSFSDGDDCTGMIKNPHFDTSDGWTKVGFAEFPTGLEEYHVAEGYSIVFDVYQEITNLQNGLYELNLFDLYRPANYGTEDYEKAPRAYVYMNGFEKNLNTIESGAIPEQKNSGDTQIAEVGFVPNDVAAAASAFQEGRYAQTLYALVTDGTLKIGVRNDLRYEGCWAVWSDMKLTFRAKNATALEEVLQMTMPQADALVQQSKCGQTELNALSDAISVAENETDGYALYDAFVTLKLAMDNVVAGTAVYTDLKLALDQLKEAIASKPTYKDIAKAQALYDEALSAYEAGSYNTTQAQEKIVEVSTMTVAIKFDGGDSEEQDVTSLIVNPNFDPEKGDKATGYIEGWTTSAMNGYKQNTVSYNRAGIELHQTINGLKKGHYKVTVHTYYRAGYYDEEWNLYQTQGADATHLTTLYAITDDNDYQKPVMNLFEGANPNRVGDEKCYQYSDGEIKGWFAPDGTSPTVAWFDDGRYLNELEFDITEEGGSVTIGLEKKEIIANDYEVVGAWNLYYYGNKEQTRTDVTSLIVNPDFDPEKGDKSTGYIEGWTTSAMNGYKQHTVSYNRAGIELHQTINGLPKGEYEVTVHTYYRAGYYDEERSLYQTQGAKATHLTTLYAITDDDDFQTPVMNLFEGANPNKVGDENCYQYSDGEIKGWYAPDGTTPTVAWFNDGRYLNTLPFTISEEGGSVTIGLEKKEIIANDYEVVGAWHLYYLGDATRIQPLLDDATLKANAPDVIFNLQGQKMHDSLDALPAGIYISGGKKVMKR